jgi:hemoglobin/transferrin/lactoferrin receptor protein
VISIETKDVEDLLAPGDGVGYRLLGGYASNGETGQASATVYGRRGAVDALGFLGWLPMGADLTDGDDQTIRASQLDVVNGVAKLDFQPNAANRFELGGTIYRDDEVTPPNAGGDPETDLDRVAEAATLRPA